MIFESVFAFATNPEKMTFVVLSLLTSVVLLLLWKYTSKTALLYAHLGFALAPLFYFASSINCKLGLIQSLLGFCTAIVAKGILYILPLTMIGAFLLGIFVVPRFYLHQGKELKSDSFSKLCKKTKIAAKLYVLDKATPVAFAFADKIFVSVGMFESFSSKEIEAVLLHELYHVKQNSSWTKFSSGFVHAFSPFASFFSNSVKQEERKADAFARKVQKMGKYLGSARKKVSRL
ncbi:MAG TPA: M48 family metalloprotease [Candidatus Nanoarchaeia archaeon]|nr:M48 family metalloprotease [Candidatus Nanoarchaeia archaeon]